MHFYASLIDLSRRHMQRRQSTQGRSCRNFVKSLVGQEGLVSYSNTMEHNGETILSPDIFKGKVMSHEQCFRSSRL